MNYRGRGGRASLLFYVPKVGFYEIVTAKNIGMWSNGPRSELCRGVTGVDRVRVLFLCGQNTARSQIAEAFLKDLGGKNFVAESAGLEAGPGVNPLAAEIMREIGIDIAGNEVTAVMDLFLDGRTYDYVIAVCNAAKAGQCPYFPGVHKRLHWPFDDIGNLEGTTEEQLSKARKVRDQIRGAVERMVADILAGREPE